MTQDEALKLTLQRLEQTAADASEGRNTMLVADLVGPISLVRGVIAEREKAEKPSKAPIAIAISCAALLMALAGIWAGFYAVHVTSGTWMEVPAVVTTAFFCTALVFVAMASADIAKYFVKGTR